MYIEDTKKGSFRVLNQNNELMAEFFGNSKDQAYYRACVFLNGANYQVGNMDEIICLKKLKETLQQSY